MVAFAFGLLHGLGFAGALSEIGLSQFEVPIALLFFNLGVEVGQLVFVIAVLAIWAALQRVYFVRHHLNTASAVVVVAVGSISGYWVVERFWSLLGLS